VYLCREIIGCKDKKSYNNFSKQNKKCNNKKKFKGLKICQEIV